MNKYTTITIAAAIIAGFILFARSGGTGKKFSTYFLLILVACLVVFPFYSMVIMATHTNQELFKPPPPLWVGDSLIENLNKVTGIVNIPRAFVNSLIVSLSYTAVSILFCSMGGYAFAMYRFPGRKLLFSILMATMMLPAVATIIPWYIMMSRFGWVNSFLALIIPGAAGAFGIFFMRQYCFNNVPADLLDAAKIDGCPEWQIFFKVAAPILTPACATLGVMNFTLKWNDFMAPFLVLKDTKLQTVPLMLQVMQGNRRIGPQVAVMQMASVCVVVPVLIVYLFCSKYVISGVTAGAIKE
jgi:ABC-type glycerol-3-phosphate transport system permease component